MTSLFETLEKIENTSSKIEKTKLLAQLFKNVQDSRLPYIVNGQIWPPWEGKQTNVSLNTLLTVLKSISRTDPEKTYIETGDVGKAAEEAVKNIRQKSFFKQKITIERLYKLFEEMAHLEGSGSQEKRKKLLTSLFIDATPLEAKYIARLITGDLRIGVADGIIRDAIAQAYDLNPQKIEKAYMITSDWCKVIELARQNKIDSIQVQPGHPIAMMLASVAPTISDALKEHEKNIVEYKYDGARVQVHKDNEKVKIYSRRLEDVTQSLPEITEAARQLSVESIIFEGEALAIDENGKVLPFQYVLRRFRRKKNIDRTMKSIKIEVRVFDVLYVNGQSLIDAPLYKRREKLEEVFSRAGSGVLRAGHALITDDPQKAEEFYRKALDDGHEGVMIKDLQSTYEAGKRGKKWLKYKPIMEPLDLVITAAEWGEGKRANVLGAFEVSVLDENTGEYLPVGKVGTGFSDDDLKEFTEMLKPLIKKQEGKRAVLEPRVIITVAYQEIQKSPKYRSGYALRFPRYAGLREDKSEPDTLSRVEGLYRIQRKRK